MKQFALKCGSAWECGSRSGHDTGISLCDPVPLICSLSSVMDDSQNRIHDVAERGYYVGWYQGYIDALTETRAVTDADRLATQAKFEQTVERMKKKLEDQYNIQLPQVPPVDRA
jgi:hypothetical protein